jgi:dissimilatory sulfite reductase (desulfoviridin) alpha/beta subunit
MEWTKDAEQAVGKVPFFVRKRVKKRVEEEAARSGSSVITLEHVKTCQKRFLNQMEDEVNGYQVEACFGPTGCPNRAVIYDDFPKKVEALMAKRNLKPFLKEKVQGPLKLHHEFRISISDCPNACSRPQIADLGLIGAQRPKISAEVCIQCGACVDICREGAIILAGKWPIINFDKCVSCGQCIPACPTRTLQEEKRGFRIQVGGKLGRHPRLARELPGFFGEEEALRMVNRCLDHYQKYCVKGERFGEVLEKTGIAELMMTS